MFRIPGTMDCDLRCSAIDCVKVVSREPGLRGAEIFVEPLRFRRAWYWNDRRLLRQQPGQCNLRRRSVLALGEGFQPLDEGEVRFPIPLCESRHDVAKVGWIERRLIVDLSGEKAFAEWAEWHQTDTQF